MVTLRSLPGNHGGFYFEVMDNRDPDVLTMFIVGAPAEGRAVFGRGVHPPEDEREAWTFDLDTMKEEQPQIVGALPPWASGKISVEPTAEGSMWRFDITPEMVGIG